MTHDVAGPSVASGGSPFLLGVVIGLLCCYGYLLNRIAVVSHRVDMAIMAQQSQDARLDALEKK
jgi:hypothetical protein